MEYFFILMTIIIWGFIIYVFLTVISNVIFWPKVKRRSEEIMPIISVVIPARNEEKTIGKCIQQVIRQSGVKEIIVYNDESTDSTEQVVLDLKQKYPGIQIIQGKGLPAGWTGKNHACQQLANAAGGEWILFLDADTRIENHGIADILMDTLDHKATFASCWPGLELQTFWEKLLMPMLNFFVYTVYPAPISFKKNSPSLGIAHGACILAKRDVYMRLGGHARVKNEIFEDTKLARLWRAYGEVSLCFDGQDIVRVRMYESLKEIWSGFQKNFFPGFKTEITFWLFLFLHAMVFLFPFIFSIIELFQGKYFTMMQTISIIVIIIRTLLTLRFRHPIISAILHPFPQLFLIILGISSRIKFKSGDGVEWKGRKYSYIKTKTGKE